MTDDTPSRPQWLLYFWLELRSLWPAMPPERVMVLARRASEHARRSSPEQAAAALALGLGGVAIH